MHNKYHIGLCVALANITNLH